MPEANPMRWVVLSLLAGGLFAIGMVLFVNRSVERAKTEAAARAGLVAEKHEERGMPLLDQLAAVVGPFVAHVGAERFSDAHALLAAPYRRAVSVESFARTCRAATMLAGARSVSLLEARRQAAAGNGGAAMAATLEARGVLETASGAVPVSFVLLMEGTAPRILVMSVAGVPLLQGVAPAN